MSGKNIDEAKQKKIKRLDRGAKLCMILGIGALVILDIFGTLASHNKGQLWLTTLLPFNIADIVLFLIGLSLVSM
jgi:hypothetical protein